MSAAEPWASCRNERLMVRHAGHRRDADFQEPHRILHHRVQIQVVAFAAKASRPISNMPYRRTESGLGTLTARCPPAWA